ncbi:putative protein OS=Streptomyces canus OX=58343 GN=AQJ46_06695 PE=4 SV=1 [Streptomyces canus]
MVVSTAGHGLFDAVTGERIARDRDPDPETGTPDAAADLTCPGLRPVTGSRVHIDGLYGGGLHSTTADGRQVEVVSPFWPNDRGGSSSTPTTPNSGPSVSPPPAVPSPWRQAAT